MNPNTNDSNPLVRIALIAVLIIGGLKAAGHDPLGLDKMFPQLAGPVANVVASPYQAAVNQTFTASATLTAEQASHDAAFLAGATKGMADFLKKDADSEGPGMTDRGRFISWFNGMGDYMATQLTGRGYDFPGLMAQALRDGESKAGPPATPMSALEKRAYATALQDLSNALSERAKH